VRALAQRQSFSVEEIFSQLATVLMILEKNQHSTRLKQLEL
jgi:hypothetical protein